MRQRGTGGECHPERFSHRVVKADVVYDNSMWVQETIEAPRWAVHRGTFNGTEISPSSLFASVAHHDGKRLEVSIAQEALYFIFISIGVLHSATN